MSQEHTENRDSNENRQNQPKKDEKITGEKTNSDDDYLYILRCKFCKKDFKTKSDMDLHNTTIHGMALENSNINFYQVNNFTKVHWVFKCTKCPAEMSSESTMMEHIEDNHPEALNIVEKDASKNIGK